MMGKTVSLFNPDVLSGWAKLATDDQFVQKHSVLANLCFGMHNTETGEKAWLAVSEEGVQSGQTMRSVSFQFEGDNQAFAALSQGVPFNRLIRQHQLVVGGDLRCCVQNWLLLYALMRLTAELEG